MRKQRWTFLFCLFLLGGTGLAQVTITGEVTSPAGRPVRGANVLLKAVPDGTLLHFAVTDSSGRYAVSARSAADSVILTVSHLNFAPQERRLLNAPATNVDWVMSERVYELPALTVKQEPVTRRGDTLVFNVSAFREDEDRSIEDLMRRIPGVTVSPNGRISYQDLEISKFYIEGLDMLEGRYAIATRNLSLDVIRDVEVIEQHQHIRALDSLERPPNAAVNLRLKSKVALTGTASAALGAAPVDYQLKASLFGFTKQRQFSLLGSANTLGEKAVNDYRDLYAADGYNLPLVSTTTLLYPYLLRPTSFNLNDEAIGGVTYLQKVGSYAEVKLNGYLTRDRIVQRGTKVSTLFDGDTTLTIREALRTVEEPFSAVLQAVTEVNRKRFYLKYKLDGRYTSESRGVSNLLNGTTFTEDLDGREVVLRGSLSSILRRGSKAYRLKGEYDFERSSNRLLLQPFVLPLFGEPSRTLARGGQVARTQSFRSRTYTNFYFKHERLRGNTEVGLRTDDLTLFSRIENYEDPVAVPLGDRFGNDNRRSIVAPYLQQGFTLRRKSVTWQVSLPVAAHFFSFSERSSREARRQLFFVARPALEFGKQTRRQNSFSLAYAFEADYERNPYLYDNFLLRQNRQVGRSVPNLNRSRGHSVKAGYRGESGSQSRLTHNSSLTLSTLRYDFIASTTFDSLSQLTVFGANDRRTNQLRAETFLAADLLTNLVSSLRLRYSLISRPLNVNDLRARVGLHLLSVEPKLSYTFSSSVLSLAPRLEYLGNPLAVGPIFNLSTRLKYYHKLPGRWGELRLTYDRFRFDAAARRGGNDLVNLSYERSVFGGGYRLTVLVNNLTGEADFVTFNQATYFQTTDAFRLRPRQLVVRLTKGI